MTLSATDATSGVAKTEYNLDGAGWTAYTASISVSGDGSHTLHYRSTDNAGNQEADQTLTAKLDTTPPSISFGTQSPAANANGWNNSDVSIPFTATDATSGIASTTPVSSPLVLTGEGTSLTGTVSATDNAGNSAKATSPAVKIDRTPPMVSVTGVTDKATYTLGNVPTAGCDTSDALSGVATKATPATSGGTANGVGSFTVTCSGATDTAGNAAAAVKVSYSVHYAFSGFFSPVSNPPVVNAVKAGSAVPLKWSLGGVSALSSFVSVQWSTVSCGTLSGTSNPVGSTTSGDATLRYDATAGQFIDNLATQAAWAGMCSQLTLTLDDGTTDSAFFSFK